MLLALEGLDVPATLAAASFAGTRPLVPHDDPDAATVNPRVELSFELDRELLDTYGPTQPPPQEADAGGADSEGTGPTTPDSPRGHVGD